MRLLGWLAGWRIASVLNTVAQRRVWRRVGHVFESLETRVVLANPRVSSIVPDPSQPGANVDNPRFVVTFSAAVTGVDAADFLAAPLPGVMVAPVALGVTGSGTTYTVTVNGVSGVGTLGLNLVDNNSIHDGGGNGLVGNSTFQAARNFATGTSPYSVAVGDVNGDGQPDLAVANRASNSVSVLRGNGDGTFQAAQNFATGLNPFSLAVGDVNGDGRPDLVVANQSSNTVSVLLGNGNGTFQAAQNFATGSNPLSVAVGDLNGDGRLDLTVANNFSNTVSVLLGNGNGTFQAAQNFATGSGPRSVTVGDINGDGRLDLAVPNLNSNTVSVLLGNGNGTFQAAQNFGTGSGPVFVAVGDVNGDGRLDLAVASYNIGNVSVLLGNGNGTFQAAQNFATGSGPISVAVGDVDGDGRSDLAVANQSSNTVSVLFGNGNGTFRPARNFGTGSGPISVAVGDVNGDGLPDLAVANYLGDTVSVLLNAANGDFTGQTRAVAVTAPRVVSIAPDPSQSGANVSSPRFLVTFNEAVTGVDPADFVAVPGPGVSVAPGPLVVSGSGTTWTVTVNGVSGSGTLGLNLVDNNSVRDSSGNGLVGNGNGTFQAAQNFATGNAAFSVVTGDMNGDGRLDLAVANSVSGTVSVLLGNGNGTFQAAQNFGVGVQPRSVAVGDLNGDGRLDLAVANSFSDTVSVLLGNGNGTFQAAQNFGVGVQPRSVAVGDVNGDGRPDLAVGNNVSFTVSVLLGNGNGTFQSAQNFATGLNPYSVAVGDVNGDGRLDLAVANYNSANVSVLLGNGNGSFQAAQNFTTGGRPYSVAVGDLNGDGRQDLAVANFSGSTVSVLLGNGNGTFQAAQNFSVGFQPRSVAVGDLNGDGRLDLATANFNSDTVSVLLGNGNGTFQNTRNSATGSQPYSVVVGDMNGDGRLDLAVANRLSNAVSVLLNATNGNFTGQVRTVDTVAPTVASILRENPLAAVTGADQITFRVTFSEAVQNVSTGDFRLGGTSAADGSVNIVTLISTSVYNVAITGVTNSNGTIQLLFAAGQNIADLATNALVNTTPTSSETYTLVTNRAPTLNASGNPFAILGAGSRQSAEMRQGTLVSDILARGAGGNPISDPDAGALRGIALTAVDQTLGNFQFTLVTNNPQEADWVNVDAAGAISNTSALLLPTTARLRFNTGRVPHHASAPFFLSVESKLDAGLTFRAWDQTSGAAGGRANTSTNGGSSAFSTATETSKVYFEVRLFRSFNPNASLNVYTLEAEFNALTAGAFEDRSTDAFTGFTVLLSAVPELGTAALFRLYFGIQFNDDGTETDMGYRYLTSNQAEAEFLEGIGPASKRPQREGTYFRELGVSDGTAIIGYVFNTQQPGTSQLTQIYRTDTVNKPTRPPGTSEGGTPTSFKPQENGDHVYTTNTTFEATKTGTWRVEAPRGFVRPLGGAGIIAPATAAPVVLAAASVAADAGPNRAGSGSAGLSSIGAVPVGPNAADGAGRPVVATAVEEAVALSLGLIAAGPSLGPVVASSHSGDMETDDDQDGYPFTSRPEDEQPGTGALDQHFAKIGCDIEELLLV